MLKVKSKKINKSTNRILIVLLKTIDKSINLMETLLNSTIKIQFKKINNMKLLLNRVEIWLISINTCTLWMKC